MNNLDNVSCRQAASEWLHEDLLGEDEGPPIVILSASPDWVELLAPCEVETAHRMLSLMSWFLADLNEQFRDSVEQALHELLFNAVEWGGGLDPSKQVRISFLRGQRMVLFRIADPGRGFRLRDLTHSAINNPVGHPALHMEEREKKGLRPGGYGLMMVRAAVDELIYNELQNEVVIIKYLDAASSRTGSDFSEER